MTNFNKIWEDFSQMLIGSNLTEGQKCWLLLKLQSFFTKEIACADNRILSINQKLSVSSEITTKSDRKLMAEKAIAKNYRDAYIPLQEFLNKNCKEIINAYAEFTPTEKEELEEAIDSPFQCDNANTRKKIRKILCGFSTNATRKNNTN